MWDDGGPDLGTEEGQKLLEPHIGDAELIIIDKIATAMRDGQE
jgi:hypothetical protein